MANEQELKENIEQQPEAKAEDNSEALYKRLLRENKKLRNELETYKEAKDFVPKVKSAFIDNGGIADNFEDYYNKHSKAFKGLEEEEISELIKTTKEQTKWAFDNKKVTAINDNLKTQEVERIKTKNEEYWPGTIYKVK